MNKNNATILNRRMDSVLATNKVLRNTYILLSMTLLFSGLMAYMSVAMGVRMINPFIFLIGLHHQKVLFHFLQFQIEYEYFLLVYPY